MAYGGERGCDIGDRYAICGRIAQTTWPLYHDDRQAKPSRRVYLAVTGAAAGVLGYNGFNAVLLQHADFFIRRKRAASGDVTRVRHLQRRFNRIDAADQITVHGSGFERRKLLSAKCQKRPLRRMAEGGNGLFGRIDTLPRVSRPALPGGTRKHDQRNLCKSCRFNGIGRNSGRIGMGGIHKNIETLIANELCEADSPAKATASHRHGLFDRRKCTSRHGQQNSIAGVFRQPPGQNTGIRRAAEYEYGACHDL